MAAGQLIPFQITIGALPLGWAGDAQATLNALGPPFNLLQISLNQGIAFFQSGGAQPSSNQGPWLKNGQTWYVWSDALGTYVPEIISQASLGYIISSSAPDPTIYQFWIQISPLGAPLSINTWNPSATPPAWQPIGYSQAQINAFFSGVGGDGKQQVAWADVINYPPLLAPTMVGNTAQLNALTPVSYNLFFNTDINALLVYYGGIWHTVDGCPGDVKFCSAATLATALLNNPGWSQNTMAIARFLIAAGNGSSQGLNTYTNGQQGGAQSETLAQNQLPASLTGLTINGNDNDNAGVLPSFFTNSGGSTFGNLTPASITNPGGGQPVPILPPFIAYWCLIKN